MTNREKIPNEVREAFQIQGPGETREGEQGDSTRYENIVLKRSQARGGRGSVPIFRGAFGKPFPEGILRVQGLSLAKREFMEKGYGASL